MPDFVFAAVRFAHFASAMQLFGLAVFFAPIVPQPVGVVPLPNRAPQRGRGRGLHGLRGVAVACVAVMAVTSVAWLALVAGAMGDGWADALSPATMVAVLTETQFGRVWQGVFALDAALIVALVLRSRWWVIAALGGTVLVALGLVGHPAAAEDWRGVAEEVSQIVHLLAAGFWLGSLLPLAWCLRAARDPVAMGQVDVALRRFSGLGHVAVALALITGVINTGLVLGHLPVDFGAPYQALLAAKVALVVAMIGLALSNRYVLMPRLSAHGGAALYRSVIAEIALGAGVVLLVSALGMLAPQ